uniref:UMOD/GP2/OIT3-like D8C domain-containing protein n=1 Tax=Oreochromis aureus TaxID=47969 RepID=A0A668RPP7_OREAU
MIERSPGQPCYTLFFIQTLGDSQSVDPCNSYTVLNDEWRSTNNINNPVLHCDRDINWHGWYRLFLGNSSARIPERCTEAFGCGTHAAMWITEAHPTQPGEIVTPNVCSSWHGYCCWRPPHTIQVKLCYGGYYVYKLESPPSCYFAYCTGIVIL